MKTDDIDAILLRTLDDGTLSRTERRALSALLEEERADAELQAFFRHRAFDLVKNNFKDPRHLQALDWLEEVLRTQVAALMPEHKPLVAEAHFSPGDECRRAIIGLVSRCRRQADICVFTITDDRITEALLEAHGRGVRMRIIGDDEKAWDPGSDLMRLAEAGVPVRVDRTLFHMHHKFALFDEALLLTGSYNWTVAAARQNEENLVVVSDQRLVQPFVRVFETCWESFAPIGAS